MRRFIFAFACAIAIATTATSVQAGILVTVDKSDQRLSVAVDGFELYTWPTSTARAGYVTPNGTYHPQWLARKWFSRKYHNSPMPYSIFFYGGFAIHGSYETRWLGQPASHGCVRLLPSNAKILFDLVRDRPLSDTTIVVTGSRPASPRRTLRRRRRRPPERPLFDPFFDDNSE